MNQSLQLVYNLIIKLVLKSFISTKQIPKIVY